MTKTTAFGLGLLFFLTIQVTKLNGQVTIGSSSKPINGALLDLKYYDDTEAKNGGRTADKGLGLPRVKLTDLKALTIRSDGNKTEIPNTGTNWQTTQAC